MIGSTSNAPESTVVILEDDQAILILHGGGKFDQQSQVYVFRNNDWEIINGGANAGNELRAVRTARYPLPIRLNGPWPEAPGGLLVRLTDDGYVEVLGPAPQLDQSRIPN